MTLWVKHLAFPEQCLVFSPWSLISWLRPVFRFVVSDVTVLGSHGCLVGLFALTKHSQTSSAIKRLSLNKENLCLAESSWWTQSPEWKVIWVDSECVIVFTEHKSQRGFRIKNSVWSWSDAWWILPLLMDVLVHYRLNTWYSSLLINKIVFSGLAPLNCLVG